MRPPWGCSTFQFNLNPLWRGWQKIRARRWLALDWLIVNSIAASEIEDQICSYLWNCVIIFCKFFAHWGASPWFFTLCRCTRWVSQLLLHWSFLCHSKYLWRLPLARCLLVVSCGKKVMPKEFANDMLQVVSCVGALMYKISLVWSASGLPTSTFTFYTCFRIAWWLVGICFPQMRQTVGSKVVDFQFYCQKNRKCRFVEKIKEWRK